MIIRPKSLAKDIRNDIQEVKLFFYSTSRPCNRNYLYRLTVPTLPEQPAIATIFSDMDAEIAARETKLDNTRQLKQGMMHNLLTGRVRLV